MISVVLITFAILLHSTAHIFFFFICYSNRFRAICQ